MPGKYWARMSDEILDCLVIGGGPAGLTAAIYLSRYHLDILVVDGGKSRAAWIPTSHNHAGYPEGINGKDLLRLMRSRPSSTGRGSRAARSRGSNKTMTGFRRRLGLAVRSRRAPSCSPPASPTAARRWTKNCMTSRWPKGLIRYCPICDGYEVTDKKVGVIGDARPRPRRGDVPAQLHRRRDADRSRWPDRRQCEDRKRLDDAGVDAGRWPGRDDRTWRSRNPCRRTAAAAWRSPAFIRRWAATRTRSLAEMLGREAQRRLLHRDRRRTSAPAWRASMPRATWSTGSTRSAMPWAKAGLPSTTIRNDLCEAKPAAA